MTRLERLLVVVTACLIATSLVSGVAYAYYRTGIATDESGKAVDAAVTMDDRSLTFTLISPSTAALYPNGPAGTASIALTNPYDRPITITGVNGTATGPTCTAGDLTSAPAGVPATVPPGTTTVALTEVVRMTDAASSNCQGATVTVTVTIVGRLA